MSITLYYFPTPNGRKVSIALEEMQLDYRLQLVNIFDYEAQTPGYRAICPNARIPALVEHIDDEEPVVVFESGAILQYLGRKSGRFYPKSSEAQRALVDSWVFWQMASLGPMSGQITWFKRAAKKPGRDPIETSLTLYRFTKEVKRLYNVLESQLAKHSTTGQAYICGDYSIADMACWPWVNQYGHYVGELQDYPHIYQWHQRIAERSAVKKAMAVGLEEVKNIVPLFK